MQAGRQIARQKAKNLSQKNQNANPPVEFQIVFPARHFSWNGGITQKFRIFTKKKDMPTETKVVDKTMRKDPSTGKMVKSENYRGVTWTEKTKTKTRGGVVRKRIVGENFSAIQGGKPVSEKSVKIEKFNKSGKLKKSVTIADGKKTISRPGMEDVTKGVGFIASRRLNKNI